MAVGRTLQRSFTRLHCRVYRATGGTFGAHLHGAPVLLLRTTGRRTGRRRETPLLYFADGERHVIVASNGGAPRNPFWFLNLESEPDAEIQIGRAARSVRARPTAGDERERLWQTVTARYPGYVQYQERTTRQIPVVVLEPRA